MLQEEGRVIVCMLYVAILSRYMIHNPWHDCRKYCQHYKRNIQQFVACFLHDCVVSRLLYPSSLGVGETLQFSTSVKRNEVSETRWQEHLIDH